MYVLWSVCLALAGVLRDVCDRTLGDAAVPKAVLLKRASALKIIGAVFEGVRADKPAATTTP